MRAFALGVFVLGTLAAAAKGPGMKVVVSDAGVSAVKDTLLPYVYDLVAHTTLADINGTASVPVVGDVTYALTDVQIPHLLVGKSSVEFDQAAQTLVVSASGLQVDASFLWAYNQHQWPHAHDTGKGVAIDRNGAAKAVFAVGYNATTRIPQIRTRSIALELGQLKVKLESHSGSLAAWFEQLVANTVLAALKHTIERAAASALPAMLDATLDTTLVVQPFQQQVLEGVGLDYSFPARAVVTPHNMAVAVAGEFYPWNSAPGTTPGEPEPLPDTTTTGQMVEVYVSEWALASLARAAFYGGRLSTTLTADTVPEDARMYFVSGFYATCAPGVVTAYGSDAPMAVVVNAQQVPNLTVAADGFDVEAVVRMALLGKKAGARRFTEALVLDARVHIDGVVTTDGERLVGRLEAGEMALALVDSAVGPVSVDALRKSVVDAAIDAAVAGANKRLAAGIPLPTLTGLAVRSPVISWSAERYLLLSGDIQYDPPQ